MDPTEVLPTEPLHTAPAMQPSALVLGRYRLEQRLGAGGFGVVWRARDERLERPVAVKVMPHRKGMGKRAEREALAAARLNHPAIVTLYEAGSDGDAAYLVSELVEGEALDDLLADGALSDRDVLRVGVALCDAGWTIASPAETIARNRLTDDLAVLRKLLEQQSVRGLVIGLPLNMDGSDSPRTQSTRAFARNLAPLDLPILLWDERWSTAAVTRTLIDADASRRRRDELVDKLAAGYILQGAIDALRGA